MSAIQTASGHLMVRITDAERTLPLAALRDRIFDPCRAAYAARFPDEMAEYDRAEARLIASL